MKTHSDELAVFVQVVESGSFSRAAERLRLANSAVSHCREAAGRQTLSANLLNRTTRQLRLTEEGCRFFEARAADATSKPPKPEIFSAGGAPRTCFGWIPHTHAAASLAPLSTPVLRTPPAECRCCSPRRRLHRPHRAARGHRHPCRQPARLCLARPPSVRQPSGNSLPRPIISPATAPQTVADLLQHTLIGFSAQNPEQLAVCRYRPHALRRRAATVRQQRRYRRLLPRKAASPAVGLRRGRRYCCRTPAPNSCPTAP